MKRILVCTSHVPFVRGGHLVIAENLVQALKEHGFDSDLMLTPQNPFGKQISAYLATYLTDVSEDGRGRKIDQLITLRFPSYVLRHKTNVVWLNHRMREYYDLWELFKKNLSTKNKIKEMLRRFLIHRFDNFFLKKKVTKIFAQSKTVQSRLRKWGNIYSEVLYPPAPKRKYRTETYENFIFTASRLYFLKRNDLLIESFSYLKNKEIKAYIAGDGEERENLKNKIKQKKLENRVFLLGEISEEELLNYYSKSRAIFYAPYLEDFGFVTIEAFSSRKPVITTFDSGGPSEIVEDGENGFVVEPDPERIAEKIDYFAENRDEAERMGGKGYKFSKENDWEKVVKKLVIV
ncbi:MAG: glycosyltransferase family 4 protein [Acidobacteriota bacterium]